MEPVGTDSWCKRRMYPKVAGLKNSLKMTQLQPRGRSADHTTVSLQRRFLYNSSSTDEDSASRFQDFE